LRELKLEGFFTCRDLQVAVGEWSKRDGIARAGLAGGVPLSSVAREIGPIDFSRLLLTKGIESELLLNAEAPGGGDRIRYGFRRS
jgi:hypothetical protein